MIKKALMAVVLSLSLLVNNAVRADGGFQPESILYSEAIAKEFGIANVIFGCAVVRNKFYSDMYKQDTFKTCVEDVNALPNEMKENIFSKLHIKKNTNPPWYSMHDMLIIGKFHYILGCYSAHTTALPENDLNKTALIKQCTRLSDMVTPTLIHNFGMQQKTKKTT